MPIDNNVSEREMKRVVLGRISHLFVGDEKGGRRAAVLASLTSTCRRYGVHMQPYLTQLLTNLPGTPISQIDQWLPDRWRRSMPTCCECGRVQFTNRSHLPPVKPVLVQIVVAAPRPDRHPVAPLDLDTLPPKPRRPSLVIHRHSMTPRGSRLQKRLSERSQLNKPPFSRHINV